MVFVDNVYIVVFVTVSSSNLVIGELVMCNIHDCIVCQFLGMQFINVRWQVFENLVVFNIGDGAL